MPLFSIHPWNSSFGKCAVYVPYNSPENRNQENNKTWSSKVYSHVRPKNSKSAMISSSRIDSYLGSKSLCPKSQSARISLVICRHAPHSCGMLVGGKARTKKSRLFLSRLMNLMNAELLSLRLLNWINVHRILCERVRPAAKTRCVRLEGLWWSMLFANFNGWSEIIHHFSKTKGSNL